MAFTKKYLLALTIAGLTLLPNAAFADSSTTLSNATTFTNIFNLIGQVLNFAVIVALFYVIGIWVLGSAFGIESFRQLAKKQTVGLLVAIIILGGTSTIVGVMNKNFLSNNNSFGTLMNETVNPVNYFSGATK